MALPILIASSWSFHHGAVRRVSRRHLGDRVAETLTVLQEGLGVRRRAGVPAARIARIGAAYRRVAKGAGERVARVRRSVNIRGSSRFLPPAQAAALIVVLLAAASMAQERGEISIGTITSVRALTRSSCSIRSAGSRSGSVSFGKARLAPEGSSGCSRCRARRRRAAWRAVELPREAVLVRCADVTFGYSDGPSCRARI